MRYYLVRIRLMEVTFMVTRPPIDPVRIVYEICQDTLAGNKRIRWAQRFTPIQLTAYANITELTGLAEKLVAPIFNEVNSVPVKVQRPCLIANEVCDSPQSTG